MRSSTGKIFSSRIHGTLCKRQFLSFEQQAIRRNTNQSLQKVWGVYVSGKLVFLREVSKLNLDYSFGLPGYDAFATSHETCGLVFHGSPIIILHTRVGKRGKRKNNEEKNPSNQLRHTANIYVQGGCHSTDSCTHKTAVLAASLRSNDKRENSERERASDNRADVTDSRFFLVSGSKRTKNS